MNKGFKLLVLVVVIATTLGATSSGHHLYSITVYSREDAAQLFRLTDELAENNNFVIDDSAQLTETFKLYRHLYASAWLEVTNDGAQTIHVEWIQFRGGCSSEKGVEYSKEAMKTFIKSVEKKIRIKSIREDTSANKPLQPTAEGGG
jgi:hypothetical protein